MKREKTRRTYRFNTFNKGLTCPFKPINCQEGWCKDCEIYYDSLSPEKGRTAEDKDHLTRV